MGKYENTLRYVQLGKLLEEKKYAAALEMAEAADTDRIKEVQELKLLAEVYIKNELYDKARDMYKLIYEQIHTRRILYKLILLCIKSGNTAEAASFYEEYLTRDKNSIDRYTLKYRIDKASGADSSVIIEDLKAILNEEYSEKWAYELARQYHKAKDADNCVAECHKIMQWFFGSETAKKASLLKQYYTDEIDEDILENFKEGISADVNKYMQQEEQAVEAEDRTDNKESDVAETYDEVSDNEQQDIKNTENNSDIDIYEKESIVSGSEDAVTEAAAADEAEAGDEEQSEPLEGLSKYGQDIPYTHLKYLFRGLAVQAQPPINIAIAATEPTYYLTVVKKITKELQNMQYFGDKKIKIAKIDAGKLNSLKLDEQITELIGSCIMIENASAMNPQTINSVIKVLDSHASEVVVILIDEEEALSKMFFKEEILKNQIKYFVIV